MLLLRRFNEVRKVRYFLLYILNGSTRQLSTRAMYASRAEVGPLCFLAFPEDNRRWRTVSSGVKGREDKEGRGLFPPPFQDLPVHVVEESRRQQGLDCLSSLSGRGGAGRRGVGRGAGLAAGASHSAHRHGELRSQNRTAWRKPETFCGSNSSSLCPPVCPCLSHPSV